MFFSVIRKPSAQICGKMNRRVNRSPSGTLFPEIKWIITDETAEARQNCAIERNCDSGHDLSAVIRSNRRSNVF